MNKIRITSEPTYAKYVEGVDYVGKGIYLGISKNAHKFKRHDHSRAYAVQHKQGPKYHFEKV
jgi:hypothetical protein